MELVNDEEIIAKLAAAGSAQECYDLVKDRIGISFEEFQASMAVANAYVNEPSEGELSEDDMDSVAGGKGNTRVDFTKPKIELYHKEALQFVVIQSVYRYCFAS